MTSRTSPYYDSAYFLDHQISGGEFGGWADIPKFQPHIAPTDKVLDFGCGGGYLLERLVCGARKGVEINPPAREAARSRNLDVAESTSGVEEGWADVIISN